MKFRNTLLLLFLILNTICFAQKEVASITIDDKSTISSNKKEGYSFSNTQNGDLAILMISKKTSYANLFDKDFKLKSTITFESPKYDEILGYSIKDNTYKILLANTSKKKYEIVNINFNSKATSIDEFNFDFEDEKYLETIQYNNKLLIFSATKDNNFTIRELSEDGFSTLKTFMITEEDRKQKLLKRLNFISSLEVNVTKIDNRVPNAIDQVASSNKIYQKGDLLYLTVEDDEELQTLLYKINLGSLTMEQVQYPYPVGKVDAFKKYNSFILDDKIFQLGSSNDEMKITVKTLGGELLKDFYIERDLPINFKNSAIIQDGNTIVPFVNRRELEETSKYLRKVSGGDIGITGYKDGDLYKLTIGGFKKIASGGGGMMMGGGMAMGATGGAVVTVSYYNPTLYSFNSYNSTKSTFFNTHLDENFNYVAKEESDNIFDRIDAIKKEIKYESAEDVFMHQGQLYFSYYNQKEKIFKILEM